MIKAIGFDLDNTLIKTLDIKAKAFSKVFGDYYDLNKEDLEVFFETVTITGRRVVFEKAFEKFLNKKITDEEFEELNNKYVEELMPLFEQFPLMEGIPDEVKYFYENNKLLFVVTGAIDWEAKKMLEAKKIDHYFQKIYGDPMKKIEGIKKILDENDLAPQELVFIGDNVPDIRAPKTIGCHAVGVSESTERRKLLLETGADIVTESLVGIHNVINQLFDIE